MKLTKDEKQALLNDIASDLPENFAVFSPWTSLWLLQIVLMMVSLGVLIFLFISVLHPIQAYEFIGVLMGSTILVVVPNALIVHGYSDKGLYLLRVINIALLFLAVAVFYADTQYLYPCLLLFIFSLLILWLVSSIPFKVFLLHRKEMGQWRKLRKEKNKIFIKQLRESRAHSKNK